MSTPELDPTTLRFLAAELDAVAERTGTSGDREEFLWGFVSGLAATYRTRALQVEGGWKAPTRELPIVRRGEVGDGTRTAG